MSLKKTKDQLVKLTDQAENNVIALFGKWRAGKTHLWNEVLIAPVVLRGKVIIIDDIEGKHEK